MQNSGVFLWPPCPPHKVNFMSYVEKNRNNWSNTQSKEKQMTGPWIQSVCKENAVKYHDTTSIQTTASSLPILLQSVWRQAFMVKRTSPRPKGLDLAVSMCGLKLHCSLCWSSGRRIYMVLKGFKFGNFMWQPILLGEASGSHHRKHTLRLFSAGSRWIWRPSAPKSPANFWSMKLESGQVPAVFFTVTCSYTVHNLRTLLSCSWEKHSEISGCSVWALHLLHLIQTYPNHSQHLASLDAPEMALSLPHLWRSAWEQGTLTPQSVADAVAHQVPIIKASQTSAKYCSAGSERDHMEALQAEWAPKCPKARQWKGASWGRLRLVESHHIVCLHLLDKPPSKMRSSNGRRIIHEEHDVAWCSLRPILIPAISPLYVMIIH